MKSILHSTLMWCFVFAISITSNLNAQSSQNVGSDQLIQSYLQETYPTKSNSIEYRLEEDQMDKDTKIRRLYVQQQHAGIDIIDAMLSLHYAELTGKNTSTDVLNTELNINATSPSITADQAVRAAMIHNSKDFPSVISLATAEQKNNTERYTVFQRGDVAASDMITRLVYVKPDVKQDAYRLAWETQLYTLDKQHYWVAYVDAQTGKVLKQRDLVLHCSFGEHLEFDASPEEQAKIDEHRRQHLIEHAREVEAYIAAHKEVSIPVAEKTFMNSTMMVGREHTYKVLPVPADSPEDGTVMPPLVPNDPSITQSNSDLGVVESYTPGTMVEVTTGGHPEASPFGWTSASTIDPAVENNETKGNNVWAFYDPSPGPLGGVPSSQATTATNTNVPFNAAGSNEFLYDYDFSLQPGPLQGGPLENQKAAITTLFYMNNMMHDVFYQFGFTEANRNFQLNNYGKGGQGNDDVLAQAQDGGGTNNANMLTLRDGVQGQMQMYLWTSATTAEVVFIDPDLNLTSPYQLGATYEGKPGSFPSVGNAQDLFANPQLDKEFALINDGCGNDPNNEGCGSGNGVGATSCSDVSGRIAVLRRGSCSFVEKVQGADQSGAVAVIVVNNVDGPPISMGGTDATSYTIDIPSVMISKADGEILIDAIQNGPEPVRGDLKLETPPAPMRDGDFDNGVIAHEYGHGISTRTSPPTVIGGSLSGDEQGGEGWSDYWGLYMTLTKADLATDPNHPNGKLPNRGIGNYVTYQEFDGPGIRPQPYSIGTEPLSAGINTATYETIGLDNIPAPHGVGFVWCTMLYELTQNMIDMYGFSDDIFFAPKTVADLDMSNPSLGGNNVANILILEGIRNQPPSPTFVQQRNAILTADELLFDGAHRCEIWKAFAKRGLGFSADAGSNAKGDETQAFDLPFDCDPTGTAKLTVTTGLPSLTQNSQQMVYTVTVTNEFNTTLPVTDAVLTETLSQGLSFVSASVNNVNLTGVTQNNSIVTIPVPALGGTESVDIVITVDVDTPTATGLEFFDTIDDGSKWSTTNNVPPGVGSASDEWSVATTDPFSGTTSWYVVDPGNFSDQQLDLLASEAVTLPANAELVFYHSYATEAEFDGGRVFINTGTGWTDLGPNMTTNGYNDEIPAANANPPYTTPGPIFGGGSGGYLRTHVDLSSFSGDARFRFQFGADVGTGAGGWAVDDVLVGTTPTYRKTISTVSSPTALGDEDEAVVVITGNPGTALPIEMLSFNAKATDKNIVLDWATATEIDNKGFHVERRTIKEGAFTEIGFVAGAGNSTSETKYNFVDKNVTPGVEYFYRLRQLDQTNKTTYSEVRTARVEATDNGYEIELMPNPTNGVVSLNWTKELPATYEVEVISANGQVVLRRQVENTNNQLNLDLSAFPANLYFVKVNLDSGVITKKLMLKK